MAAPVPKPAESTDDFADRTMELDMRWLHDNPEVGAKPVDTSTIYDDPTVVIDMTPAQVNDLLSQKK